MGEGNGGGRGGGGWGGLTDTRLTGGVKLLPQRVNVVRLHAL